MVGIVLGVLGGLSVPIFCYGIYRLIKHLAIKAVDHAMNRDLQNHKKELDEKLQEHQAGLEKDLQSHKNDIEMLSKRSSDWYEKEREVLGEIWVRIVNLLSHLKKSNSLFHKKFIKKVDFTGVIKGEIGEEAKIAFLSNMRLLEVDDPELQKAKRIFLENADFKELAKYYARKTHETGIELVDYHNENRIFIRPSINRMIADIRNHIGDIATTQHILHFLPEDIEAFENIKTVSDYVLEAKDNQEKLEKAISKAEFTICKEFFPDFLEDALSVIKDHENETEKKSKKTITKKIKSKKSTIKKAATKKIGKKKGKSKKPRGHSPNQ